MSRCIALCLMLGLLAVGGAGAATRQAYKPDASLIQDVVSTLKDWVTPIVGIHPSVYDAYAEEEEKFHLVMKFVVPPKHTKEFTQTWLDAKEELEGGVEGLTKIKLFKIFTDNTCLVSYQEWDSWKAFKEACKSDKGKKLKEFVCEKDIAVFIVGMCPIEKTSPEAFLQPNNIADTRAFEDEDLHAGMMAPHELEAALSGHRDGGECKPVVISKYIVYPSCAETFVKRFLEYKGKVLESEDGAKCYGLAKALSDNIKYVGYEEWESKEALHEHLKTKEFKEFCKFIHEGNIPMKLAMAVPVESMESFE